MSNSPWLYTIAAQCLKHSTGDTGNIVNLFTDDRNDGTIVLHGDRRDLPVVYLDPELKFQYFTSCADVFGRDREADAVLG